MNVNAALPGKKIDQEKSFGGRRNLALETTNIDAVGRVAALVCTYLSSTTQCGTEN